MRPRRCVRGTLAGVRSQDLLGALDLSPAERSFTVDTRAPSLTRARIARRFRLGRRRTPINARTRRGSAFRYTLSERATVRIRVQRCVRFRSRSRRRCRRYRTVRTLTRGGEQGSNRHTFTGRFRGVRSRLGLFRATLSATDEAGNRSASKRVAFRIVRR